jgi:hypothetical protein
MGVDRCFENPFFDTDYEPPINTSHHFIDECLLRSDDYMVFHTGAHIL